MEFISCGGSANIFVEDGIAIKKYYNSVDSCSKISLDIFNVLKDIKNPNFIDLIDIDFCNDDVLSYRYHFIKGIYTDIVYRKNNYTLNNINKLEVLIKILTNEGIIIDDTNAGNIILQSNNMVIIDPDYFHFRKDLSYDDLLILNKYKLLSYFERLYSKSIATNKEKVHDLFRMDINYNTDLAYELSKKLTKSKPIDVLR